MAELIEDVLELLAPWPTASSLATALQFESANEASTSAQLAVPLLVSGMVQRLKDPALAHGVLDLLPSVDTDGLRDLEGVFRERLFEPVGTYAVERILAGQHEQAASAVAEEVGCTTASSYRVFPAMAWLLLGVISVRHGAAHDRHTYLNVARQEEAELLRTGWGVWMSVVGPEARPSSPRPTTPGQVLNTEDVAEEAAAAPSYPPPVSRASRQTTAKPDPPVEPVRAAAPLPAAQRLPAVPLPPRQVFVEAMATDRDPVPEPQRSDRRERAGALHRSYGEDDGELDGLQGVRPASRGRGVLLIGAMFLVSIACVLVWYFVIRDQMMIATAGRIGQADG